MARSAILKSDVPSPESAGTVQGGQTQLESWVHQSFIALERLHAELNEWQHELTSQQDKLEQRKPEWIDSESGREKLLDQIGDLQKQLEQARKDASQREEELSDRDQEYEKLDRRCETALLELKTVRKYSDQLSLTLDSERQQNASERRQWNDELKEIRCLMERQCSLLE